MTFFLFGFCFNTYTSVQHPSIVLLSCTFLQNVKLQMTPVSQPFLFIFIFRQSLQKESLDGCPMLWHTFCFFEENKNRSVSRNLVKDFSDKLPFNKNVLSNPTFMVMGCWVL